MWSKRRLRRTYPGLRSMSRTTSPSGSPQPRVSSIAPADGQFRARFGDCRRRGYRALPRILSCGLVLTVVVWRNFSRSIVVLVFGGAASCFSLDSEKPGSRIWFRPVGRNFHRCVRAHGAIPGRVDRGPDAFGRHGARGVRDAAGFVGTGGAGQAHAADSAPQNGDGNRRYQGRGDRGRRCARRVPP